MPRLFTALEIPPDVAAELSLFRGGIAGGRWIEPASYHVTLRFFGDVDRTAAREIEASLAEARRPPPLAVTIDGLGSFGGDRPRAVFARIIPTAELSRVQAEHEKLARRAGLAPETRKFMPHVTLVRLRDARPGDVAAFMARAGHIPPLRFLASRLVLLSSRASVGGGPYVVEAAVACDGAATSGALSDGRTARSA